MASPRGFATTRSSSGVGRAAGVLPTTDLVIFIGRQGQAPPVQASTVDPLLALLAGVLAGGAVYLVVPEPVLAGFSGVPWAVAIVLASRGYRLVPHVDRDDPPGDGLAGRDPARVAPDGRPADARAGGVLRRPDGRRPLVLGRGRLLDRGVDGRDGALLAGLVVVAGARLEDRRDRRDEGPAGREGLTPASR